MADDNPWTDTLGFTDLSTADREETIAEVKRLIKTLADEHPDIFDDRPISPQDYNRELRDAIFSLGGKYRQSHGADNEDIVREVFLDPAQDDGRLTYVDQRGDERIDFKGRVTDNNLTFAMDVKGGEGQSLGHLLVPGNSEILVFWSERNSRNTKPPSSRLNEVINRVVRWGINHAENPSYMVIRDVPAGAMIGDGQVIPDVVVFPTRFPSPANPDPEIPSLDDLHFAELIFEVLIGNGDLRDEKVKKHIWWHDLHYRASDGKVEKRIYNAYDESIKLQTHSIDFERISEVV